VHKYIDNVPLKVCKKIQIRPRMTSRRTLLKMQFSCLHPIVYINDSIQRRQHVQCRV
jgi:hypothetical protein